MNTEEDGAWITRRMMQCGLAPVLLTGSACAIDDANTRSNAASAEPGAKLTVTGRLTDEGVECQAFRGDDGQLYTLVGELSGWKAGARVRISGQPLDMSFCQQGTTIRVSRIQSAEQ